MVKRKTVPLAFRMEPDDYARLRAEAEQRGLSDSEMLRLAVRTYIDGPVPPRVTWTINGAYEQPR